MIKRYGWLWVIAILASCSPDEYRKSADLQVDALVKDRQKRTLEYTPQVEAPVTASTELTRKSYEKIPTSPMPPTLPPVLEPAHYELRYDKLGPEELFPEGAESPRHQAMSIEEARAPATERLRLGPPATLDPTTTLDLFQAVEYAVQHSREYQTRMEDLYLAALSVTLERHLFEPRPFANVGALYTGGQLDVDYRSALSITSTAGVRQQLPYGGEIVAQGLVSFVNALSDNVVGGESAELALSGTIPLLRGAGMVNLEPLIRSERQLVYAVRTFEDFRRNFVVSIAAAYFELLTRQQAVANRRFNYVAAVQLTEQSYALFAAGRTSTNFLSVQRAQSQLFSNENNIISAEDDYQRALDVFKILIGMPVDQPLNIVAVELDIAPPDIDVDVVDLALKYRLDLQTASDQIEDARRSVGVASNGLLPDLDLTARGTIGNRDSTPARQIDSRTMEYSAGLNLDLPIDRVAERNAYRRALIELERAQRNWVSRRDDIVAQVRNSVRAIRSAAASLEINRRRVELAQKRLEYSNELLILGRASDSRDSVDAQNELISAQDAFENAKARYQTQVLNFLRDTGLLRVNPQASTLGLAMDRARAAQKDLHDMDPTLETQTR
jgi:outer membrane protein TolC